jgi:dihydroxy-acid dehydratase
MTKKLRSSQWFDRDDEVGVRHRSVLATLGYDTSRVAGRPVIGICNPWSELNNCELPLNDLASAVKRGIVQAGGIPLEFSAMPLGGELLKPSDLIYRNLVAMEVEETLRGYPIDGVVLLCNCDKTTPAQLMAAASADLPAIQLSGGPKAVAYLNNQPLSSGTDFWKYWDEFRAGNNGEKHSPQLEACLSCSAGACNEMGTTSTMTAISETLGMMPSGTCTIPANDSRRLVAAERAGRDVVRMVDQDLRPGAMLTRPAFENAIRVLMALGGSTNAVVHLIAIAGRRGIHLPLSLFDEISASTPLLANLKPSGEYLVADLHRAGGLPALLKELEPLLNTECVTVSGALRDCIRVARCQDRQVIRPLSNPMASVGGLVALSGNLVPSGAVLKVSAASPGLLDHTGPALVFDGYEEMLARIDDEDLEVMPTTILVMKNVGPRGGPGMPEWGMIPIPRKLLKAGVRDMVRISDARMSGTAFGTVVLHAAPEAAVGGPLAAVRTGDVIRLSVAERKLEFLISEGELQKRLSSWSPQQPHHLRGYVRLFVERVLQADQGCDLDFLRPSSEASLRFVHPLVGRT